MSHSLTNKLAVVLCFVGSVFLVTPDQVVGQRYGKTRQRVRRVQFEESVPLVELPNAAIESEAFPPMQDIVPPTESLGETIPFEAPSMADAYEDSIQEVGTPIESVETPFQPVEQNFYENNYDRAQVDNPAPLYSTGSWFRNGSWFSELDVLAWTRSKSNDGTLSGDVLVGVQRLNRLLSDAATGEAYLFNDAVGHNFKPGARIKFGQFLGRDAAGRDHTWDFTFLGLFDWQDNRTFTSRNGGSLISSFTTPNGNAEQSDLTNPLFSADRVDIAYSADMNSVEMNYTIRTRPGRDYMAMQPNGAWVRHGVGSNLRSVLAGFRALSFNELVDYGTQASGFRTETDETDGEDGTVATETFDEFGDATRGRYLVHAHNDMIGFQLGGELEEKSDAWTFGVRGKVGGLFNFIDRRKNLSGVTPDRTLVNTEQVPKLDADGEFVFDANGDQVFNTLETFSNIPSLLTDAEKLTDENLAFLAEVSLYGTYQLRPNLYFRAGYDLMFISGIALSAENMYLGTGFGALVADGSVLMHGGSVGFESTW